MKIMILGDHRKFHIQVIRDYDEDIIEHIYDELSDLQRRIESKLEKRSKEIESDNKLTDDYKQYLMDFLSVEYYESELIRELAGEIVIIFLFKTVEIVIKSMIRRSGLFTENELHSFFRISDLKRGVRDKVVDIEKLHGYSSYDELRCINNSIKHQGKVNNELA